MTTTPPPMPEALVIAERLSRYKLNSGYAWHCHKGANELRRQHERIAELEADRKMLREALEAMPRHVEELCTVYGVPLPQATFDKASTALRNTHD